MALHRNLCLGLSSSVDPFEDRRPLSFPSVGSGTEVVMGEMNVNGRDQLCDAREAALADNIVGKLAKEALHQVHPRGAGGGEVNVDPGMLFEPGEDQRMFVGGVVVHDQVQGQFRWSLAVDGFEEGEPFQMSMPLGGRAEDASVEVVQRCKEGHRAMAGVVVSASSDMAYAQGQPGLGALQGLALALLIAAQYKRLGRRVKVQADHVPKLGFKMGVVRQFESPGQMRLDLVGCPDALDARRRDADLPSHRAHAPACTVRRGLGRLGDQLLLLRLRNRRFASSARGIHQPRQPQARKPAFPADNRRPADAGFGRRAPLRAPLRPQQDDPGPLDQTLRRRWRRNQTLQLRTLIMADLHTGIESAHESRVKTADTHCHAISETLH